MISQDNKCKACDAIAVLVHSNKEVAGNTISIWHCDDCGSTCRSTEAEVNDVIESWIFPDNRVMQLSMEDSIEYEEKMALKVRHYNFVNMNTECTECEKGKLQPTFNHAPGKVILAEKCTDCGHTVHFTDDPEELKLFIRSLYAIKNPITDLLGLQIETSLAGLYVEEPGCAECESKGLDYRSVKHTETGLRCSVCDTKATSMNLNHSELQSQLLELAASMKEETEC